MITEEEDLEHMAVVRLRYSSHPLCDANQRKTQLSWNYRFK